MGLKFREQANKRTSKIRLLKPTNLLPNPNPGFLPNPNKPSKKANCIRIPVGNKRPRNTNKL